jgi:hypothetical protein
VIRLNKPAMKLSRPAGTELNRLVGIDWNRFARTAKPIKQLEARTSPFSQSSHPSLPVRPTVCTDATSHQPPEAGKIYKNTHISENSGKHATKSGKRSLI